ncbi:hypothetical protein, partial [Undibacterium luofuense]|uniref:hypothetical protein n=1 Tax=Undibacterium luofuense TaxID=2828733 RepID=UPI0030EB89BC
MINQREVHTYLLNKVSHNFKFNKEGSVDISVTYYNMFSTNFKSDNTIIIPKMNDPIINEIEANAAGVKTLLEEYHDLKETHDKLEEKIKAVNLVDILTPEEKSKNIEIEVKKARQRKYSLIEGLKKDLVEVTTDLNNVKRHMTPFFKDLFLEKLKTNLDLYS